MKQEEHQVRLLNRGFFNDGNVRLLMSKSAAYSMLSVATAEVFRSRLSFLRLSLDFNANYLAIRHHKRAAANSFFTTLRLLKQCL